MTQAELQADHFKTESEVANVSVDFSGLLDGTEVLNGTPTVEELISSGLTISNVAINTGTIVVNGQSRTAGLAVTFRVSGGSASSTSHTSAGLYKLKVTVTTDAGQTRIRSIRLWVSTDP